MGLKDTTTGDTLCAVDAPVVLEKMDFPEPVIKVSCEPTSQTLAVEGRTARCFGRFWAGLGLISWVLRWTSVDFMRLSDTCTQETGLEVRDSETAGLSLETSTAVLGIETLMF